MDKKFLCNLHITHNHQQQVVMVLIFLTDRLRIKFVEYLSFKIEQSIKYERWTEGQKEEWERDMYIAKKQQLLLIRWRFKIFMLSNKTLHQFQILNVIFDTENLINCSIQWYFYYIFKWYLYQYIYVRLSAVYKDEMCYFTTMKYKIINTNHL